MPTRDLDHELNRKEALSPQQRRSLALEKPFRGSEGRDPALCVTRMVGRGARRGEVGYEGEHRRKMVKFISQLSVDLDSPAVWRFRAEFDERDLDIPLSSWDDFMLEAAVDEMRRVIPDAGTRQLFRDIGSTFVEWRTPLTEQELILVGGIPILDS